MLVFRIVSIILWCITSNAFAQKQGIDLHDLIISSNGLNNTEVVVVGEVIGDIFSRGEYSWVNIQQNEAQMSLWVPSVLLKEIRFKGDYHARGDLIEVSGNFMRSDPELEGEMRIKVDRLEIIQVGENIKHPVEKEKIEIVFILLITLVLLVFMGKYIRKLKNNGS